MVLYKIVRYVFFSCMVIILFVGQAEADYQIGYMYVMHRTYEDGTSWNKLNFEVTDDLGNYINNTNIVSEVKLIKPNGEMAVLGELFFQQDYEFIGGTYNCSESKIIYDSNMIINAYWAEIEEPLIPGTYTLEVKDINEIEYTRSYYFDGSVNLAFVPFKSFEIRTDFSNNIFWTWAIPDSLFTEFPNISMSARAYINIFNDDQNVAYFHIKIPAHMGHIFISREIVQLLMTKGNKFHFGIDIRDNTDNNRAFSNILEVEDLFADKLKVKKAK